MDLRSGKIENLIVIVSSAFGVRNDCWETASLSLSVAFHSKPRRQVGSISCRWSHMIFLNFVQQGSVTNAQEPGGGLPVPLCPLQSTCNCAPLGLSFCRTYE